MCVLIFFVPTSASVTTVERPKIGAIFRLLHGSNPNYIPAKFDLFYIREPSQNGYIFGTITALCSKFLSSNADYFHAQNGMECRLGQANFLC